jgi:hypothetical protein
MSSYYTQPAFIFTGTSLTVYDDGQAFTATDDDNRWDQIITALRAQNWAVLLRLMNPAPLVAEYLSAYPDFKIEGRTLYFQNVPMAQFVSERVLFLMEEGIDAQYILRFLTNVNQNPSRRAVHELYEFLEVGDMPITPDGCFIAYKRVRDDDKDIHSGTIENRIGATIEMPRNQVDDDSHRTCSYGLHFASREYLRHFNGARLLLLKINPADVVSIPVDYNHTKGRCCRYTVIGELTLDEIEKRSLGRHFYDDGCEPEYEDDGCEPEYEDDEDEDDAPTLDPIKPNSAIEHDT